MPEQPDFTRRITRWLARHAGFVIVGTLAITAGLAVPFLTMQPTSSASQEPTGRVFDARDRIEEDFASAVFQTITIVEARPAADGVSDMLRVEPLRALHDRSEALRRDPVIGPSLFSYYDADEQVTITGLWSLADIVDSRLPGGLAGASDADVKTVVAALIAERGPTELGLSAQTSSSSSGPISPAIFVPVLSDDTLLGFGSAGVRLGSDTKSEEYSRSLLNMIRGEQVSYQAWGVAIDVNLTSEEEGALAGPFIGLTIAAVLAVVGLTFRSYWILAITGGALATLIIWLEALTNLIGLKDDLILSLIVPIAMISFGVDSVFHAVSRYREETNHGSRPRAAFTVGMAAVAGALVLALASDSAAFLSNTSAGIESIIQFGIGSAIALVAAFLLLGIVTPLAIMVVEDKVGRPPLTRRRSIVAVVGSIGAAMLAMASVLMSVFVYPPAGLVLLGVYLVVALFLPYRLAPRRLAPPADTPVNAAGNPARGARAVGNAVTTIARRPRITTASMAVLTVGAALLAVQVPTEFDVKDFFSANSDFVVGLDKLDEHGGDTAGEPADFLIETDLTDPDALARIARFVSDFESLDTERFARGDDGRLELQGGIIEVVGQVDSQPAAQAAIEFRTGVELTDLDDDGLPDSADQIAALIETTREIGVPIDQERALATADAVRSSVWSDGNTDGATGSGRSATRMSTALPGSRQVENIAAARALIEPLLSSLESDLQAIAPGSEVTFTGGPIARQESLDAISRALLVSLPIALGICLLIAAVFMRSFRLALIVIVPILIVVAWLYAFMFVFGYAINLVTATIGALSIGIGIDFAIHLTERYREELTRLNNQLAAIRAAAEGTGVALIGSAMSSIVGFAIMAFAPMPLFASYGLLTAVMIAMALLASLVVLPSLLVLVGPRPVSAPDDGSSDSTAVAPHIHRPLIVGSAATLTPES